VIGAVLDALAEAGVEIGPAVLDRVRETVPPADFLRT
jgi:hypothetical protein